MGRLLTVTYSWARRCAIAFIGGSVVLIGVMMIVLPGPAFVVIPAGLAILGLEFACARRWLKQLKASGDQFIGKTKVWLRRDRKKPEDVPAGTAATSKIVTQLQSTRQCPIAVSTGRRTAASRTRRA